VIEHDTTADFDPGAPRGPSRLEPGVTFGVHRRERAIGHGGMGEVWLARRTDGLDDTHVAIKTLHAHLVTTDGVARLLDFGIARLLEANAASGEPLTQLGARALTLEYAAPEPLTGDAVTTATDIYAMGVVLYALLSGASPYGATRSSPALLETGDRRRQSASPRRRHRDDPTATTVAESRPTTPAHLRQASAAISRRLSRRRSRRFPTERYGSAAALVDGVRRYLAHQPVAARPDRLAYRLRQFVRRNRVAVAAGGRAAHPGHRADRAWRLRGRGRRARSCARDPPPSAR
jgi:hypothetical protein